MLTAIDALIRRIWKCFTIQIIPATFPSLGITTGFGKLVWVFISKEVDASSPSGFSLALHWRTVLS
jgi:hypothetical protein